MHARIIVRGVTEYDQLQTTDFRMDGQAQTSFKVNASIIMIASIRQRQHNDCKHAHPDPVHCCRGLACSTAHVTLFRSFNGCWTTAIQEVSSLTVRVIQTIPTVPDNLRRILVALEVTPNVVENPIFSILKTSPDPPFSIIPTIPTYNYFTRGQLKIGRFLEKNCPNSFQEFFFKFLKALPADSSRGSFRFVSKLMR